MFGQGLALSGIGILITFSALGILILIILTLKALFPAGPRAGGDPPQGVTAERETLRQGAAAAGVAALRASEAPRRGGNLGAGLESPRGDWWRRGLDSAHGKETR